MSSPLMPASFTQWQHCIVNECGIVLDKAFIEARIQAMENRSMEHTKQFVRLYGEAHYARVLQWFYQAREELK
ncbi:hypothetical protein [Bowmanella denitrificans]|uniref:hypothetical protein n=1 Tax=Bowmanella denitrificans TaxID=366582 RepID=UPI000C9ABD0F|nr:hypothetical protein [Bowmanella denitrificans]